MVSLRLFSAAWFLIVRRMFYMHEYVRTLIQGEVRLLFFSPPRPPPLPECPNLFIKYGNQKEAKTILVNVMLYLNFYHLSDDYDLISFHER